VSFRIGRVGPRGIAVLGVTAIVGVVLANHGWSTYHGTTTPGSLAGGSTAQAARSPTARPTRPTSACSSSSASPTSGPSGSASPGPLLSSEPYAQYAFQVWPGTPSAAAKAALTGLSVSVTSCGQSAGLSVTAGVNGQPAAAPHLYTGGVRVYVVEASMGDDSGSSDYNLGDDGLVVTDAEGRIVQ
jgi:hypothetical protein